MPPAAARQMPPSLTDQVDIETPEQIVFSYTIAGIGSRAVAAIVDAAICGLSLLVLSITVLLVVEGLGRSGVVTSDFDTFGWLVALWLFGQFAVIWLYNVLSEGLRDGQTPGKRMKGIRVVSDGGYSVSFGASAVRNLIRIVDMLPPVTYAVGVVAAVVSKNGKRLGDVAAGTIVVHERTAVLPPADAGLARDADPAAAPALATLLRDDEFGILERYVARRQTLEPERRMAIAAQLAARFRARVPDLAGASDAALLVELFERERRARSRGVASRSDTGARREQHAIVAEGARRWSGFAARLADARRRGLGRMTEDEISAFVADYRELTVDYARLRTATRGRENDTLFYLGRLVGGAHNLLYQQRPPSAATVWHYVSATIPREVRRSWRPVLVSALLLFGPAALAFTAVVRHPELGRRLVPPELIDRAETARERERRGEGYLPAEEASLRGAYLTSAIMTNNLRVTFAAFAGGIVFGLGTVMALVVNGAAALGAPLGLYQTEGVLDNILGFIAAHGVLELTAIVLSGAAGLLIGSALLLPGSRTRGEAVVERGRRAIRLVAACAILLVVAGTIEGTVSPAPIPVEVKYAVSVLTALGIALWFSRGRGGSPDDEAPDSAGTRAAIS